MLNPFQRFCMESCLYVREKLFCFGSLGR